MNPKKNVLIITSSLGNGHKIVARNLENALENIPQIKVHKIDILNYKTRRFTNIANKLYSSLTKYDFPWFMFFHMTNNDFTMMLKNMMGYMKYQRMILEILEKTNPDIIISTWPGLDRLLTRAKNKKTKFYSIITDIVSVHKYWKNKGVDKYFVNDKKTKANLVKLDVPKSKIQVSGYPLPPDILGSSAQITEKTMKKYGLHKHKDKLKLLCLSGVSPKRKFVKMLREINEVDEDLFLMIINFKNRSLAKQIDNIPIKHDYIHLEWTDEFYELLQFCDGIITKAGPGVVAESLFFKKYLVLYHYIPGQEKGVKDYVVKNKLGEYISKPEDIKKIIPRIHALKRTQEEYDELNMSLFFWNKENLEDVFKLA